MNTQNRTGTNINNLRSALTLTKTIVVPLRQYKFWVISFKNAIPFALHFVPLSKAVPVACIPRSLQYTMSTSSLISKMLFKYRNHFYSPVLRLYQKRTFSIIFTVLFYFWCQRVSDQIKMNAMCTQILKVAVQIGTIQNFNIRR